MEEFIGKIWDRFITDRAIRHYPDAIVHLDEVRRTAGIFFRLLAVKVDYMSKMRPILMFMPDAQYCNALQALGTRPSTHGEMKIH